MAEISKLIIPNDSTEYTIVDENAVKTTGTITSGHITEFDSDGHLVDSGLVASQLVTTSSDSLPTGAIAEAEITSNKVTSLSASSTNTQYPSAKAAYDAIMTKSTVTVSASGESTDEVKYITIDGVQKKLPNSGEWGKISGTLRNQTDLQSALNAKATTTSVSEITGKIPAAATTTNQLADKDFVNSSINSVTAFYITKNAAGDQFASKAELDATTTFYSGGEVRVPTRNDYCIVQSDETHSSATTRYIYQNGQWEFQYVVNETAMTAAQIAAINSGITSTLVSNYNTHIADTDIHVTANDKSNWNGKIDKSIGTAAGDLIYFSAANTPAKLAKGTNNQVLTLSNGLPVWADAAGGGMPLVPSAEENNFATFDASGAVQDSSASKVTTIGSTSTDNQIPSAKAVYDNQKWGKITGTLRNQTDLQTVLDNKINKALGTATGDMLYYTAANTPARLPIGTNGYILGVVEGSPSWIAAPNSAVWGNIDGTLADQTDLKTVLDAKGTYSKPDLGIPKTDLTTAVQNSLELADSALQEHQDISGKADKSTTYTKTEVDSALSGKQASLSSDQLAAANSGITSTKVSTYDGYATTIASKIGDAPSDGKQYARKNGAWAEITGGGVIVSSTAPTGNASLLWIDTGNGAIAKYWNESASAWTTVKSVWS